MYKTYGNFSEPFFEIIFSYFFKKLKMIFQNYKEYILSFNTSHKFHNSIRNILRKLQNEKIEYFKNKINSFNEKYNFELINMTYNLGENIEFYMNREYDDYEFNYIYEYVEIFQKYKALYINKIIDYINNLEKRINKELSDILITPVNISLEQKIKENYYKCINYNKIFLENKNDEEILNNENLIDLINITFLGCYNELNEINELNNLSDIYNFSLF